MRSLPFVVLLGACGAAGTSSTPKVVSYTCEDAAAAMSYRIQMTDRIVTARSITLERCTTDGWSPHAIECVVDRALMPGICIRSGAHKDDLVADCSYKADFRKPYGPGCSGFKKEQAEAYVKAMVDAVNCDPANTSAAFRCQ
jgi:hypothetical protein